MFIEIYKYIFSLTLLTFISSIIIILFLNKKREMDKQARELAKQLQEQEADIETIKESIKILSDNLDNKKQALKITQDKYYKLLDKLQHPAYIQLSSHLGGDLSHVILDYLNYKYCSKCQKIYYGSVCLNHHDNDLHRNAIGGVDYNLTLSLSKFVSQGYILIAKNSQGVDIIKSTDENDDEYLNYLQKHIDFALDNQLVIYDIGAKILRLTPTKLYLSGVTIKSSPYIPDKLDDIQQIMKQLLDPNLIDQTEQVIDLTNVIQLIREKEYSITLGYDRLKYLNGKYRIWTSEITNQSVKFNSSDATMSFNVEDFENCFKVVSLRCVQDHMLPFILSTPLPANFKVKTASQYFYYPKNYEELFNIIGDHRLWFQERQIAVHSMCYRSRSSYNKGLYYWKYRY